MNKIILEVKEGIAYITINRPEKMNALDDEAQRELNQSIDEVNSNKDIRCVLIAGSGEKSFVAGGDIGLLKKLSPKQAVDFARTSQEIFSKMEQSEKPFIACVNGYALGGGFELALACDFIYATENAIFGLPETSLAIIPGFGGTQNLSRLVGKNIAKELIFTARRITAKEAKELGIVSRVFKTKEEMLNYAEETARQIMKNGPIAVGLAKRAIVDGFDQTRDEGLKYEASLFGLAFATEDAKEGLTAFLEKRKPVYKNS
ncbi:enoyl-CoA hydratase/isomerase family protein [Hippea maritima]|uniref:Enoyl-CoA hydratase n=1 Tax=Hippea maritima (strain ATCC 700847 / DSM 10411 / MH2) TaxID=760142 RepID=F2LY45_HIPMA|nr:enoyl-CoA hydratase/isomerase family protein [Hippea maritima]AEA34368.1 Enoyl-CoA hydratase [Hippea maritima DSM 10411]